MKPHLLVASSQIKAQNHRISYKIGYFSPEWVNLIQIYGVHQNDDGDNLHKIENVFNRHEEGEK